jgi:hypothetical protein
MAPGEDGDRPSVRWIRSQRRQRRRNNSAGSQRKRETGRPYDPSIDERRLAGRDQPKGTTMSKIEEMTIEQTDEVVGGTSDNAKRGIQMSTVSTDRSGQAAIDRQYNKTYAAESKRYD